MTDDLIESKHKLRLEIQGQREAWEISELRAWSAKINEKLCAMMNERKVKVVHCFLPMGKEIDVWPSILFALQRGIKVVTTKTLPKAKLQHLVLSDPENLEQGRFGTKHPKDAEEYTGAYDLIIVPGMVFDANGGRIGYGAGYYDHFLSSHENAYKVGVCYPFQILDFVPQEQHDVSLDLVLSSDS